MRVRFLHNKVTFPWKSSLVPVHLYGAQGTVKYDVPHKQMQVNRLSHQAELNTGMHNRLMCEHVNLLTVPDGKAEACVAGTPC